MIGSSVGYREYNKFTMNITLQDIKEARELIKGIALYTPIKKTGHFSAMVGNNIYLKMENMQHTGAFKYRGARVKLLSLTAMSTTRPVFLKKVQITGKR